MKKNATESDWISYYKSLKGRSNPGFVNEIDPDIVSLDLKTGSMVATFNTKEYMRNPANFVHGGIIAAMADSAMGILAIIMRKGTYGSTADMSISYLRPVPLCTKIFIRSKCWKSGRTLAFLTCEGYLEEDPDNVLFTASSRYALVSDVLLENLFK